MYNHAVVPTYRTFTGGGNKYNPYTQALRFTPCISAFYYLLEPDLPLWWTVLKAQTCHNSGFYLLSALPVSLVLRWSLVRIIYSLHFVA